MNRTNGLVRNGVVTVMPICMPPDEGPGGGDGDRSIKYPVGEPKSMGALGALLIVGVIAAIIIGLAYWFFYGRGPSR